MGGRLLYWLLLKPLSLLPYWMLYGISDFFCFVLYRCIGYRKKVVLGNLKMAFPEKSDSERNAIAREFYAHFCDLVVEAIKNFSARESELKKRFVNLNPEVLDHYFNQGKGVIICGGHYANWEMWGVSTPLQTQMPLVAIYKRLADAYLDGKMRETRRKTGLDLVPTREVKKFLEENAGRNFGMVFAIDQSPADPKKSVWIEFLGQLSPAYFGAEKHAKELNWPMVYGHAERIKRGHYTVRYSVVTENPTAFEDGELIQYVSTFLEEDIRQVPYLWLWTHKRWKHQNKQPKGVRTWTKADVSEKI